MKKRIFSIILFLVFFLGVSIAQAGSSPLPKADPESMGFSPERLKRLENIMRGLVDKDELSGIVTSVARHGKIIYQDVYGKRDIENNKPIEMDTIFTLASMTKPVTGVAMMILYEEGKWHPADPLSIYFPEFKDLMVYAGAGPYGQDILETPRRAPTVGDLMTHTAGFSYGLGDSHVNNLYNKIQPMEVDSMAEFIKRMAKLPLLYHPGEAWVYSVSVDIQGALIERLSGMSLADFMRTRIFEPLGMKDTAFFVPKDKLDRLARSTLQRRKVLHLHPSMTVLRLSPVFHPGAVVYIPLRVIFYALRRCC